MNAAKLPKLSAKEHEALVLFRDNLEGGDPFMGHVCGDTVERLKTKGLVEVAVDARGERRFKRLHIPTARGLAVLDAMTHGPVRPPADAPPYVDTCIEYGSARLSFQIRVF